MLSNVDFASYVDGNRLYVVKDYIKEVIESLEHATVELFQWFSNKQMEDNLDICHLITSKNKVIVVNLENCLIKIANAESYSISK